MTHLAPLTLRVAAKPLRRVVLLDAGPYRLDDVNLLCLLLGLLRSFYARFLCCVVLSEGRWVKKNHVLQGRSDKGSAG